MSTSSSLSVVLDEIRTDSGNVFLLDGGTGEELFAHGLPDDRTTWSAKAVSDSQYHGLLKDVHRSFLKAGAKAITTNSYSITQHVGFTIDEVSKYCQISAELARQAVVEETAAAGNPGKSLFVLGSLGPLVESYRADLILPHDKGVEIYTKMIVAMSNSVDAFLAETMSSVEESIQAASAVMQVDPLKPFMVSYSLNGDGKLRSHEVVTIALNRILDFAAECEIQLLAIMFNCSEPEAITRALTLINNDRDLKTRLAQKNILLGAYANKLTPVDPNWTFAGSTSAQPMRTDLDPQHYYQDFVANWVTNLEVKIVGGCCGITPLHIKLLNEKFSKSQL